MRVFDATAWRIKAPPTPIAWPFKQTRCRSLKSICLPSFPHRQPAVASGDFELELIELPVNGERSKQGPAFRLGLVGWTLPGHEPARYRDLKIFAALAGEFTATRRPTDMVPAPTINSLFRPALLTPHCVRVGRYSWLAGGCGGAATTALFLPLEPRISIYV